LNHKRTNPNHAAAPVGLGVGELEPVACLDEGLPHADSPAFEVNVLPTEGKNLAPAHPRGNGKQDRAVVPAPACRFEAPFDLVLVQNPHFLAFGPRGLTASAGFRANI